jgi:hypothetical protein
MHSPLRGGPAIPIRIGMRLANGLLMTAHFQESNMLSLKQILMTGLAVVGLTTAALALSHTSTEEDACRRDVVHFCRGLSQDDQIRDCLVLQKRSISHRCRAVLESHGL